MSPEGAETSSTAASPGSSTRQGPARPAEAERLIAEARALRASGDANGAAEAAKRALRVSPEDPDALWILGMTSAQERGGLLHWGRETQAFDYLQRALAADPGHGPSHLALARIFAARDRSEDAEEHLRAARAADPDDADVALELGRLLFSARRYAGAAGELRVAVRARPDDADAVVLALRAQVAARDPRSIADLSERAVSLRPDAPEVRYYAGRALMLAGAPERAEQRFREALARDAGNPLVAAQLGFALIERGRLNEALASFRAAAEADPRSPLLQLGIGRALHRSDQQGPALAALEKAAAAGGESAELRTEIARVRWKSGDRAGARRELDAAAALDASWAASHLASAEFDAEEKRWPEALAELARAQAAAPYDASVLVRRADVWIELGRHAEAAADLDAATELAPGDPAVLARAGRAHGAAGNVSTAAERLGRAAAALPDDASLAAEWGTALLDDGREREAEPVLSAAARRLPADAGVAFACARALARTGRPEEAAKTFERVHSLEPGRDGLPHEWAAALTAASARARAAGDFARAETSLRKALELAPDETTARRSLVDSLVERSRLEGAAQGPEAGLRSALAALKESADRADARELAIAWLVALADRARSGGRPDEVEVHLRQALELGPGEPALSLDLGKHLEASGKTDEAIELALGAAGAAGATASWLEWSAALLERAERWEDALAALRALRTAAGEAAVPALASALLRASAEADRSGRPLDAARLLEDALSQPLRGGAAESARRRRVREHAQGRLLAGAPADAEHLLVRALASPPDAETAELLASVRVQCADAARSSGQTADAERFLRASLSVHATVDAHAKLAALLEQTNRGLEAIAQLEAAGALDPKNPDPPSRRVALHLAAGRLDAANDAIEALRRALPGSPLLTEFQADLAFQRGAQAEGAGRPEVALAAYRESVAHQPGHPLALGRMDVMEEASAVAAAGRGDLDEARGVLEAILRRSPSRASARSSLADVHARAAAAAASPAEAAHHWKAAVALGDERPGSAAALGLCLAGSGETKEAEGLLQKAAAALPDRADVARTLGTLLLANDRPRDAVPHLERAQKLDPSDLPTAVALADALDSSGEAARATEVLREIARSDPGQAEALRRLVPRLRAAADAAWRERRFDDAVALAREARPFASDDAALLLTLGLALLRLGRSEEAREALLSSVQRDPGQSAATHALAVIAAAEGRAEEAEARFRETLRLDPSHVQATWNLAQLLLKSGRTDDAIAPLERHLAIAREGGTESEPGATLQLADALNNRGVAHYKTGRLAEAAAALRESLRLVPGRRPVASNLARSASQLARRLEDAGDLEGCLSALAWHAEAEPGAAEPHRRRAELLARSGRNEEALAALERAKERVGADDGASLATLFGRVLISLARHKEALGWLDRTDAPDAAPLRAVALRALGTDTLSGGDPSAAVEVLARLESEGVHDEAVRKSLAAAYRARARSRLETDLDGATSDLAEAATRAGDDPELAELNAECDGRRADVALRSDDRPGAEALLRSSLARAFRPGRLLALAALLRQDSRPAESLELLTAERERFGPDDADAYRGEYVAALLAAAEVDRTAGDLAGAEVRLRAALGVGSSQAASSALVEVLLATAQSAADTDPERTRERVSEALSIAPDDPRAHVMAAWLEVTSGDPARAREHLDRASTPGAPPEVAEAVAGMRGPVALACARAETAAGRIEDAERLIEEARAANAPEEDVRNAVIELHRKASAGAPGTEEALRRVDAALALSPSDPDLLRRAAAAALALERLAESANFHRRLGDALATDPDPYVTAGDLFSRAGDESAASDAYDRALALQAEHAGAREGRARLLRAAAEAAWTARDWENGRQRYAPLAALEPLNAETQYRLGVCQMKSGRVDEAAQSFAAALGADAFHLGASLRLGWCHEQRGAHADAVQEFRKAAVIDETHPLAQALLGSALVFDDPAAAVEALARAQNAGLSLPELPANLAVAYARLGRPADARKALVQAIRSDAGAAAHNLQGYLQANDGSLAEARTSFERAVAANPNLVEARNNLACVLDLQKKHDAALDEFARASELAPGNPTILANRAVAMSARGQSAEAAALLRQAAALGPDSAAAVVNQALVLRASGKPDQAIELLQKAVNLLAPRRVEPRFDLALCLIETRKFTDALSELQAAAQMKPDDAEVHLLIGYVHHVKNSIPDAIRAYQRAADLDAKNWMLHNNLAIALMKRGDPQSWQQCQAQFKLAMRSNEASEHIGRGFSHLNSGSLHEARAEWSKVQPARPEPRPIREWMLSVADLLTSADTLGVGP